MIWRIDGIEGDCDERYDCIDWIKKDKLSQKLAFTQLYSGMGEKNALGLGFCYMKR